MKQIKLFAFLSLIFLGLTLSAQNEMDALRYSKLNYSGSARFISMGGAYGAVGADYSAASQNPGGLGLYRKSEFVITPFFNSATTKSDYLNTTSSDNRNTLYLGNLAYIWAINPNNPNMSLRQFQVGIGVNNTNTFNNRMIIKGYNDQNSILTHFKNELNNGNNDPFSTGLALGTELLYFDSANNVYANDLPNGGIDQIKTIETKGGSSEINFSFSTNFIDKIFVGASIGLASINYTEYSNLSEFDNKNNSTIFESMDYRQSLNTSGSGVNFKIGVVAQPTNYLRLGAAIHTPTSYYNVTDSWKSTMTGNFDNGFESTKHSPKGIFDYRINTPFRAVGSVAFIIGQNAIISGDYEYLDYSKASLRSNSYNFLNENDNIRNNFTVAHNLRFGAEYKYNIFSVRGGFALYGTPYNFDTDLGKRTAYSFGIGVREAKYFVDFAYQLQKSKEDLYLYRISPVANNNYTSSSYYLTLGLRF